MAQYILKVPMKKTGSAWEIQNVLGSVPTDKITS